MPTPTSKRAAAGAFAPGAFHVLVAPYPFTDRAAERRRPAIAPSAADANEATGRTVCAMITSADNAPWPHDVRIADLAAAGLPAPSVIRLECSTIDNRLILRRAGTLANRDQRALKHAIRAVIDV